MSAIAERVDQHWAYAEEVEVLTFDMNGETFALEAVMVQEILDLLPETAVPGAQSYVASVINFRGKVIPLADLRLAFGMEATEATIDSRIIVIEIDLQGERTLVGLRTDKVNEVTTLAKTASQVSACAGAPTTSIASSSGEGSSSSSPICRQSSPPGTTAPATQTETPLISARGLGRCD